jgi:large subunit ribosomal protein L31
MKKDIHPEYREVVFQDVQSDFKFLTRSTMTSDEKIKWEDGKEYPVIKVEVSSASHPFYTGKKLFVDTAGRVERFNQKYKAKQAAAKSPVKEEAPATEEVKQEAPATEEVKQEVPATEEVKQEAPAAEEVKQKAPAAEEVKQEAPATEEVNEEAPATEEVNEEAPAAEEATGESDSEESKEN